MNRRDMLLSSLNAALTSTLPVSSAFATHDGTWDLLHFGHGHFREGYRFQNRPILCVGTHHSVRTSMHDLRQIVSAFDSKSRGHTFLPIIDDVTKWNAYLGVTVMGCISRLSIVDTYLLADEFWFTDFVDRRQRCPNRSPEVWRWSNGERAYLSAVAAHEDNELAGRKYPWDNYTPNSA